MADQAPRTGLAVPDLVTDNELSLDDTLDVLRFYGAKVVAYPRPRDGAPSYYLELAGPGLDQVIRREGPAELKGFSNRARDLTGHPSFWSLLTRVAARHHLDPYHACIAAVIPDRVDLYFVHEQEQAARRAGLTLQSVRATRGRFVRTNVGWTLEVYAVVPLNGPTVPVTTGPR